MNMKRKRIIQYASVLLVCFLCAQFMACAPKEPTQIRFWHSYTGLQSVAFQRIVAEYNQTVGAQRGVEIVAYYKGSLNELSEDLNSLDKEKLPSIIEVTEESAYLAYLSNRLVSAEEYLSQEALDLYVPGFMDSGKFTLDGGTYIFPLQATLDVMYLNSELFDNFRKANPNVQMSDLRTWEDLYHIAEQYYVWTDGLTPNVEQDGRSFLAIEDVGNYLLTVSNQYAASIVQTGNKGIQIVYNYEMLRNIWDFFYSGAIRGYVSVSEDSVNNQMAEGQLVCYLASTASAKWVPETYKNMGGVVCPFSLSVKQYPGVSAAREVLPHTVSGVVVVDSDEVLNTEAYYFLDWLCGNQGIYKFCTEGKSLPVHQSVLLDTQAHQKLLEHVPGGRTSPIFVTHSEAYTEAALLNTYHPSSFYGSAEFTQDIASSLLRVTRESKTLLEEYVEAGDSYEEAIFKLEQDTFFEDWIYELEEIQRRY